MSWSQVSCKKGKEGEKKEGRANVSTNMTTPSNLVRELLCESRLCDMDLKRVS